MDLRVRGERPEVNEPFSSNSLDMPRLVEEERERSLSFVRFFSWKTEKMDMRLIGFCSADGSSMATAIECH